MSLEERSGRDQGALSHLNTRVETIHGELQDSGATSYPVTSVEVMTVQDRREIGRYLCKEAGHSYESSLYLIDQIGMVYRDDEDRYLVNSSLLDSESASQPETLLPHEMGHRFGRKVVEKELMPIKEMQFVSNEAFGKLVDYLMSENFAERVKAATGESLDEDLSYDLTFIEDADAVYEMQQRLGPEELIDPSRSEDLNGLVESVESLIHDLSNGSNGWKEGK